AKNTGEKARLIDRYEQLQARQDEIAQNNVQLKPPLQEFEKVYAACGALLAEIKKQQNDYPDDELRQDLRAKADAARAAYREKQQDRYAERVDAIRKIRQSLANELFRIEEASTTPTERAAGMIKDGLQESERLLERASILIRMLELKTVGAQEPELKQSLNEHALQSRQCREDLMKCVSGFR